IGRISDLSYVRDAGATLAIGALTRHHDLHADALLQEHCPIVSHTAGQIGDPQVRHRGTIGGSIAHGDPASDLPAALLALRGTLVARGPGGERDIAADDFFTGFLETALAPDEVLTEIRVPATGAAAWGFQKFTRRAQDWAIVGVAAVLGNVSDPGVSLVNMAPTPLRASGVEEALRGGASPADAAARADEGAEPPDDLNASAEYRRHLAQVLVRRALESAGT
ncbi:MAG TPA: FAD binding domain-containing protein, partial [Acidimicrobiales bacterium]|nr:FAD binding domain-containing protein [Acidimicrobiales bacterium]